MVCNLSRMNLNLSCTIPAQKRLEALRKYIADIAFFVGYFNYMTLSGHNTLLKK